MQQTNKRTNVKTFDTAFDDFNGHETKTNYYLIYYENEKTVDNVSNIKAGQHYVSCLVIVYIAK